MNCYLMYPDKEWINPAKYHDYKSIVQDLSLNVLSRVAGQDITYDKRGVKKLDETDTLIESVMAQTLIVPCLTEKEIKYRQDIIKDCLENEALINDIYSLTNKMLEEWIHYGKNHKGGTSTQISISDLVSRIHIINLFFDTLHTLKEKLSSTDVTLTSKGFKSLLERLEAEFPQNKEEHYRRILNRISFFVSDFDEESGTKRKPHITLSFKYGDGFKVTSPRIGYINTKVVKYRSQNSTITKVQNFFASKAPNSVSLFKSNIVAEQKSDMEFKLISYIISCFEPFISNFRAFFEQLQRQTAFYKGAVNIRHHMERFDIKYCFPTVGKQEDLCFENLKEFIMCIKQRISAIGNTCSINDKMLLIVTGANQGGKSTFLRSIGIAQIMMQCGLMVPAVSYKSGIFPSFFTHFTRREDAAMNSGRLDEELNRMSQIIDNIGKDSLILLNESFATTTEKEGSRIAYDIIKALNEAGVKILTVTHLLSFAQRVYDEMEQNVKNGNKNDVEFFSAERLPDGLRTFKMIQHAPELTSFGLDLYKAIVEK